MTDPGGSMPVRGAPALGADGDLVVCRCEDVTLAAVANAVTELGAVTADQVKKLTRAGMGMCQGRTCQGSLQAVLAQLGVDPAGGGPLRARPPIRPVPLSLLARWGAGLTEPAGLVSAAALWGRGVTRGTVSLEPDPGTDGGGDAKGGR